MSVQTTAVDRLYEESVAVIKTLNAAAELSLEVVAADHFRKALLLSAASYFEHVVSMHVLDYVRQCSGGSSLMENFVRNKAIARQYHSWFQWESQNANQFFGLFGAEFKSTMSKRVEQSTELRSAVRAFLEVGNERNKLVHQDYATFALEKTLDEIYQLYRAARVFVDALPVAFRECDSQLSPQARLG
jgi:hypothetical protein